MESRICAVAETFGIATEFLARLDLVALVVAEARVLCRAVRVAGAGRHASVTLAERLGVLVVALAAVHQVEGGLDVSAADLHCRGIRVGHMLRRDRAALIQGTIASTGTEHWLILDVDLLVVVQAQALPLRRDATTRSRHQQRDQDEDTHRLHC